MSDAPTIPTRSPQPHPEMNEFLQLFYGGTPSMVELVANVVLHPPPDRRRDLCRT